MRMINSDIANSCELHKLYAEYAMDLKLRVPTPDFWLVKFRDPYFFCLLMKHGKKPVGFLMGTMCPYYENITAQIDSVFIRRQFRGKLKWTRGFMGEVKQFLNQAKITTLAYSKQKARERTVNGK